MCEKKVPHKHAELIKAWADGAKIQVLSPKYNFYENALEKGGYITDTKWDDIPNPSWDVTKTYRIKPEPKPDVVKWMNTYREACGALVEKYSQIAPYQNAIDFTGAVKLTFDGETGKLKSAEVVK